MRTRPLFALAAAGALALAACGSDNSSSTSNATASGAAATTAASAAASSATSGAAATSAPATTADNSGGYGGGYAAPPTTAASAAAATGAASITLADSSLGKIVVDADGKTLYAFMKDAGGTSTCSGACANAWPPAAATGTPTAGTGITGTLTTITRDDGTQQLKLGSWPLYRFAGDSAKGETNGQGSNNVWYVVGADGTPIK
jgi:predicted lipoprotein with Yx(FWY)xxD motif